LLGNLCGCLTGHEVEIEHTAEHVVLEVLLAVLHINLHVHAGAGEKENSVGAILATVLEVYRVGSIQVGTSGNAVRVAVPECANIVCCIQSKVVGVLSKTVQVGVFRQRSAEAEVLVLEDERCRRRIEEDLLVGLASHFEAEWALLPRESEVRIFCRNTIGLWTREDSVGNLVGDQRSVFDLDVKALCFRGVSF
jgi:hypothetical protein